MPLAGSSTSPRACPRPAVGPRSSGMASARAVRGLRAAAGRRTRGRWDTAGVGPGAAPVAVHRPPAIRRIRLLRRPVDRAGGLDATARAYRELGVPVHVVPLGDERVSGDVAVQEIDAPREARPGTRVPVRVTLAAAVTTVSAPSFASGRPTGREATCWPFPPSPCRRRAGARAGHRRGSSEGSARGGRAGRPDEAIAANNVVPFQVMVRRTEAPRHLHGRERGPRYRFLHDALEEDPNITCVSMGVDNMHAAHPRLHRLSEGLGGYPTSREELLDYDVIICSDISRGAFTPEQLEWTAELVGKRGGGFAMIGGNSSSAPAGGTRRSGTA